MWSTSGAGSSRTNGPAFWYHATQEPRILEFFHLALSHRPPLLPQPDFGHTFATDSEGKDRDIGCGATASRIFRGVTICHPQRGEHLFGIRSKIPAAKVDGPNGRLISIHDKRLIRWRIHLTCRQHTKSSGVNSLVSFSYLFL